MGKIKISIIPQAFINPNGGVYNHCLDLQELLNTSDKIQAELLPRKISVKRLPILKKEIFNNQALKRYIKECDADIFHIHGFAIFSAIQAMIICINSGKKIVYSPHFHPFKYLDRPFFGKLFFIFILRHFLKKVRGIITINNTDTSFFERYNKCVFKIPHYLKPLPVTKDVMRQRRRILFVGRNEGNKGIEYIEKIPLDYELICVTNKPINRANTVYYSNISRKKLSELYYSASLVVIPSRYEAFSYVALESLSCGTPVLMSDHVEIATYLTGISGIYTFNYGDFDDFLQAIEGAIDRGNVDSEEVKNIFSYKKIRIEYEKAYSSIMHH